jgi:hypothetical protein
MDVAVILIPQKHGGLIVSNMPESEESNYDLCQ